MRKRFAKSRQREGVSESPFDEISKRVESGEIEDALTCGAYLWRAIPTSGQFTFAGHWNRSSEDEDRVAKLIVQREPLCVAEEQRIGKKRAKVRLEGQKLANQPTKSVIHRR